MVKLCPFRKFDIQFMLPDNGHLTSTAFDTQRTFTERFVTDWSSADRHGLLNDCQQAFRNIRFQFLAIIKIVVLRESLSPK